MTRGEKKLKPILSMHVIYSESVCRVAPGAVNGIIANLVAKLATSVRVSERRVKWETLKVETVFSNPRGVWTTTVSVEEERK